MIRLLFCGITLLMAFPLYSWNAIGHKLSAQIAYDNLTPQTQSLLKRDYGVNSRWDFMRAAIWMDYIKSTGNSKFNALHYIDLPYANEAMNLPATAEPNALTGLKQSLEGLNDSTNTPQEKSHYLKMAIHIIQDIHQPLHTMNFVSKKHPQGDFGGNLFPLNSNPIASNLHQYWDRGGGYLMGRNARQLSRLAKKLEAKWPCSSISLQTPEDWIKNSHNLAVSEAYTIPPHSIPTRSYKNKVKTIAQKQLVLAGCRTAKLLNHWM